MEGCCDDSVPFNDYCEVYRKSTDCEGSSNSHVRIPKLSVGSLKFSHALGVPLLIQMPNISSINLLKMSSYLLYLGTRVLISWQAKYIVAHMHAADVPIAVPRSWRKCILPHSKRLFLITISIASLTAPNGNPSGRSLLTLEGVKPHADHFDGMVGTHISVHGVCIYREDLGAWW